MRPEDEEGGYYILLGPDATYIGRVDGVMNQNGDIYKISDKDTSPLSPITITVKEKKKRALILLVYLEH